MSVSFSEMDNQERLYSFVGNDGSNIHVAIERLHFWVLQNEDTLVRKHQLWMTPLSPAMAVKFIKAGLVNRERVRGLSDFEMKVPIIYGKEEKGRIAHVDMFLLDGRHRYVRAVSLGKESIQAYVLKPKQWYQFLVTDVPNITQDQLDRMPVKSGPR